MQGREEASHSATSLLNIDDMLILLLRQKQTGRTKEAWSETSHLNHSQLAGLQTAKGQSEDRRAGLEESG